MSVPSTQNAFRGSFWCASAVNWKMCFSLFSLYHKHPKDRVFLCTGFQPELNLFMQNVTCNSIRLSSLPACFIVTKESEPLLRRLYAAHSSAFPLVSCAHQPYLRLSRHVLEAAQSAAKCVLFLVLALLLLLCSLWFSPAFCGTTAGRLERCLCTQCCLVPLALWAIAFPWLNSH